MIYLPGYAIPGTPYTRMSQRARTHMYMIPGTPYIYTSQRVRTHSYSHTYSTGDCTYVHTIYTCTYIVRGTSWYQPVITVPAGTSPPGN